jgi:CxxC-x17-CxxC domain-containing protein
MSDRTLVCRDCNQSFTFTAGEQAFYQERGFSEPQRCPSCRAARKSQRSSDGGGSSYSSGGGGYSSGGGGYSSGGGGGYSSGGATRELFPATCSSCGKATEVPFRPSSNKPVYCRECFQQQRSTSSRYDRY